MLRRLMRIIRFVTKRNNNSFCDPVLHADSKLLYLAIVFVFSFFSSVKNSFAGFGMHGAKTVNTSNVILNEFTTLNANVTAGASSITVASSTLNANSRFTGNLSAGELVMIIQMQGATINSTDVNASTWGNITAYNNAGRYEFGQVASVPNSTTINLTYPLLNSYTQTGKVQIVRVPRYTTFTLNSAAPLP